MNFKLKLDIPDAEQEAVWLNDFIKEHEVEGLQTEVMETTPGEGTMGGGILTGVLGLVITETVKKAIESVFEIVFKHFDGKRAAFEMEGECPDSGKKITLKFDNTSAAKRDEIQKEFERLYENICG